jgi:DNA-binding transcriptional regulator LsrR (DeoR family)
VGHLSSKVGQSDSIEWRRSKILELSSDGYNQREISQKLQITKSVVNRDVIFLRKQARESLQYHIQDRIPEEYQNCMTGMKRNLKQTLEIAETTSDPRTKLQARAIANDCYKYIMDLTTNGVVITDAIKFVQTNKEKLTMSKKENEKESKEPDYDDGEDKDQLEEKQEEETGEEETINQVF